MMMKNMASNAANGNGDIPQGHQLSSDGQTHQQQQFANALCGPNSTNVNVNVPTQTPTMQLPSTLPSIDAPPAALSTAAAVAAVSSAGVPLNHPATASMNNGVVNVASTGTNTMNSNLPVLPKPTNPTNGQVAMPQHLINLYQMPTMHYQPPLQHHNQAKAVPDVFEKMALRRGKWTPEEERFANVLIEEFEKGTIRDCENGCTLRAFLSRKLHCAPMRISKKYAGKSIGKHVFLSRASAPDNHAKLIKLEHDFHYSLVREDTSAGESSIAYKLLSSVNQNNAPSSAIHSVPQGYSMHLSQSNFLNNAQTQVPQSVVQGTQYNVGMTLGHQTASNPSIQQPWQMANAHSTIADNTQTANDASSQLQQNLLKVFKEAQTSNNEASNSSSTLASTPIQSNNDMSVSVTSAQGKGSSTMNWNSTETTAARTQSDDMPELLSGFEKISSKSRNSISEKKNDPPLQNEHRWFPDALATTNFTAPASSSLPAGQFSPTFTSKSFDDLHQYLGKEYPPSVQHPPQHNKMADGVVDKVGMPIYSMQDIGNPNAIGTNGVDETLVSPDAYALFAEQSAIEVSKHSAYCRTDAGIKSSNQTGFSQQQQDCSNNEVRINVNPFSSTSPTGATSSDNDHSAAFITENLKLHSKAVEEKEIADQVAKGRSSKSNLDVHSSVVVSASEKSSSELGSAVSSSRTTSSCASSGSDNASDNSDSASDEGCPNDTKKRKLEDGSTACETESKIQKMTATSLQGGNQ